MIITFPDGNIHTISLTSAAGWTGYIAKSIQLNGADVKTMRRIYESNPLEFDKFLLQLEARFPENRPTPVPFQIMKMRDGK